MIYTRNRMQSKHFFLILSLLGAGFVVGNDGLFSRSRSAIRSYSSVLNTRRIVEIRGGESPLNTSATNHLYLENDSLEPQGTDERNVEFGASGMIPATMAMAVIAGTGALSAVSNFASQHGSDSPDHPENPKAENPKADNPKTDKPKTDHHHPPIAIPIPIAIPAAAKLLPIKKKIHHFHPPMESMTALFNIVADLCPHGMLPLAMGMAAGSGSGVVSAITSLALFAALSAYTLVGISRACNVTKTTSFRGVWTKTLGKRTAWVIDATICALCFGCCIFYAAFIGDIFSRIASAMNITGVLGRRSVVLTLLSATVILPLCLMENLSALSKSSKIGCVGILYTAIFIVVRWLDGSYSSTGRFYQEMPEYLQAPAISPTLFRTSDGQRKRRIMGGLFSIGDGGIVTLMNIACVAFLCHYNGVNYHKELCGIDTAPDGNSELAPPHETFEARKANCDRLRDTMCAGLGGALLVFVTTMVAGVLTFGAKAQPLLLNNYHPTKDPLATLARLGTGFSILMGYPLLFAGLKGSLFSLLTSTSSTSPDDDGLNGADTTGKGKGTGVAKARRIKKARTLIMRHVFRRRPAAIKGGHLPKHTKDMLVIALVGVISAIGCICTEEQVGPIIELIGAILGSTAVYILPALINLQLIEKWEKGAASKKEQLQYRRQYRPMGPYFAHWERYLNLALIIFGVTFAITGTYTTVAHSMAGAHH